MKNLITCLLIGYCAVSFAQFRISKNSTFGQIYKYDSINKSYETIYSKAVAQLDTLIKAKKLLYRQAFEGITLSTVSDEEMTAAKKKLEAIKKELKELKKKRKFYRNEHVKQDIEYNHKYPLLFWAERSRAFYDIMENKKDKNWSLMNATGFNLGGSTSSIFTEIVSGHLYIFKISLGAMVAKSSNSDKEASKVDEAYQRLISSGGNTVLKMEYPLFYWHADNNQWTIISRLIAKGAADFPEFGTETEDWAGSGSYGLDLYADIATSNNKLRFFMNLNTSKIHGTESFISNLGIDNRSFSFGQLKLGLIFNENINLSFLIATFGSENSLKNKNVVIGSQILH